MNKGMLKKLASGVAAAIAIPTSVLWAGDGYGQSTAAARASYAAGSASVVSERDTYQVLPASHFYGADDSDGACYTNCYSACCNTCDDGGWVAVGGVEATFLSVKSMGSGGVTTITDLATGDTLSATQQGLDHEWTAAPRVWVGIQNRNGLGVVGRFWYLSEGEDSFGAPSLPVTGIDAFGGNQVTAWTADAELTYVKSLDNGWSFNGAFGYRHADLKTSSNSGLLVVAPGPTVLSASALSQIDFDGDGITFAIGGTAPLLADRPLEVYWGLRGSTLWGRSRSGAYATANVSNALGSASEANFAYGEDSSADLWIGEVTAGIQWRHRLESLRANFFIRTGFEYQIWRLSGGSATATAATGIIPPGALISATADNGSNQLQLIGVAISTGLTY